MATGAIRDQLAIGACRMKECALWHRDGWSASVQNMKSRRVHSVCCYATSSCVPASDTTMIESVSSTQKNAHEIIANLVSENWQNTNRALLLSRLGQALSKLGFNMKSRPGGLRALLEHELVDTVRIIPSPDDALVYGAVPATANLPGEVSVLFQQSPGIPRYKAHVWGAFSKDLEAGKLRYLSARTVIDIDEDEDFPNDHILVPESFLPHSSSEATKPDQAAIAQAIERWLTTNKLNRRDYIASSYASASSKDGLQSKPTTAWDILVGTLSERDLARINMPLDVVLRLQEKRVD